MIFNSFSFWVFFLLVITLYWRLPHRQQNFMLLVASYVFYGFWDWRFLGLLAGSTTVDYLVAHGIMRSDSPSRRKLYVTVSLVGNLLFLGFFKYYGFFSRELADLLEQMGFQSHLPVLAIVLPVGISFYTFQSMSLTIDVYRGRVQPARSPIDFALFVAYFPQLVAGPIERAERLLPQILRPRAYTQGMFGIGLYHVLFGLFKKVVVADNLAPIVNHVFNQPASSLGTWDVVAGMLAFALQIYGDFSGYSSIAQGISKWMGIDLSFNFRMPYFARTPSEFWQRWHVSLSSWLRDYLYVSLGGNRMGRARTYINLLLTMLLGGLWHGAAWPYVLWGGWHGLILIAYRVAGVESGLEDRRHALVSVAQALLMFVLVCVGWLFFRAANLEQVLGMLGALLSGSSGSTFGAYAVALMLFVAAPFMILEWFIYRSSDMLMVLRWPAWARYVLYMYFLLMLIIFPPLVQQIFIYFQF